MEASLRDPEKRSEVVAAIEAQAEHFDMLGLQLGYIYGAGALIPEGSPPRLDSPREYVPTAHPGARLPHAWLDEGGARRSSLDLVSYGGLTLISFGAHESWAEASAGVESCPVAHARIGVDAHPSDDAWRETCGVESTGALLVRPDQHVACRMASLPDNPGARLGEAVTRILGDPS